LTICGKILTTDGHEFTRMGKDAGPEAGVPTEAKWKMGCRRGLIGRLGRKMVVLNFTHLHAFTRFYTKFLGGNVTRRADGV